MEYSERPRYQYHGQFFQRSWDDAESYCVGLGGHLASVLSDQDSAELYHVPTADFETLWIGGSNRQTGNWSWSNGNTWDYTNWYPGNGFYSAQPNGGDNQCLEFSAAYAWSDNDCMKKNAFFCEFYADEILTGNHKKTFKYPLITHIDGKFHVRWKYNTSMSSVKNLEDRGMSGFRMKWHIENENVPLAWRSTDLAGRVSTLDLGGEYKEELYLQDRIYTWVLNLPSTLEEEVGEEALVLQLEVRTRVKEGWMERVEFKTGKTFFYYSSRKNWNSAKAACLEDGLQLASVTNQEEMDTVTALAGDFQVWLGGSDDTGEGDWRWLDGQEWAASYWKNSEEGQDLKKTKLGLYSGEWRNYSPYAQFPFICKSAALTIIGNVNKTFEFRKEDFKVGSLSVTWAYQFPGEDVLAEWEDKRSTGFTVSWFVQDGQGNRVTRNTSDDGEWKTDVVQKPKYQFETNSMVALVNMAEKALNHGYNTSFLMEAAFETKIDSTVESLKCTDQTSNTKNLRNMISKLDMVYDETIYSNISDNALVTGYELYSFLMMCPDSGMETVAITRFFLALIDKNDSRALLQATLNTINSVAIKYPHNKERLYQFYKQLDQILGLNLGQILLDKLSSSEVSVMTSQQLPFLANYSERSFNNSETRNNTTSRFMPYEVISHPVHLINRAGMTMPSAFIPFCAYKTSLKSMGEYVDHLKFPICRNFTPTLLNGELCYTVNLASFISEETKTEEGRDGELMLLLDYNLERSVQAKSLQTNEADETDKISLENVQGFGEAEPQARIYIHTLTGFTGFGAGSYVMSSLKHITTTNNFLGLSEETRSCQIEGTAMCRSRDYLERGTNGCGCVPSDIIDMYANKVKDVF